METQTQWTLLNLPNLVIKCSRKQGKYKFTASIILSAYTRPVEWVVNYSSVSHTYSWLCLCVRVDVCVCVWRCCCCKCQLSIHLHQGASNTQSPVYLSLSHPPDTTPWPGRWLCHPCQSTGTTHTHKHTNEGEETVCFSCLSWSKRGWHQPCPPSIHHTAISLSFPLRRALRGPPFMPTCYSFILYSVWVIRYPSRSI